ncbi:MAG: FAD-dependent oxidoreductase [Phycisphaerales bacterium]|nr:MAG: FAD-dependent oxidoreductase [Phycisphaerales bacterium]
MDAALLIVGIDQMAKVQHANTIIVGAGPTGLAVAYHLDKRATVLETGDRVGGLCRSLEIGGVVFDIGGHAFHTAHPQVRSFVCDDLGVDIHFQKRDAKILFNGEVVPYPWQRFFHLISDREVVEDCHKGLRARKQHSQPDNLHDLILARYGAGIARHFLFPYNRKLWMRTLDELSCNWVSQRIADSENTSDPAKRRPLDETSVVGYPSRGGFGEIFRKMAEKIDDIRLRQHVNAIDPTLKILTTAAGDVFKWDRVISTIPIPELIGAIVGAPKDMVTLAAELPYLSLQVDFFVTKQPLDGVPHRLYSADPEFPPHKLAFNSLASEHETNKPWHSIIAETSISDRSDQYCPDRTNRTVAGLSRGGFISGWSQILAHKYEMVKYAYPVQGHKVRHIMSLLNGYLESVGIHSIGRFGSWEYVNSDECLLMGAELARHIDASPDRMQKRCNAS